MPRNTTTRPRYRNIYKTTTPGARSSVFRVPPSRFSPEPYFNSSQAPVVTPSVQPVDPVKRLLQRTSLRVLPDDYRHRTPRRPAPFRSDTLPVADLSDLDFIASLLDDPEECVDDTSPATGPVSEIHKGDTDSSDDEDNKYFEISNYNSFGRSIKEKLKEQDSTDTKVQLAVTSWKKKTSDSSDYFSLTAPTIQKSDVYTDPFFGLRIINPAVSSKTLKERMDGKLHVSFAKMSNHTVHGDLNKDWVIGGVIVSKSSTKLSQKGSQYLIWRLSDLKDRLLTVSVFLFGRSYSSLWKTNVGCAVGILNPNVLKNGNDSKDEATLSVMNSDQVMFLGTSKDLGFCKSKKKNGENCTNFVNLNQCEFCLHHVQTEYRKFSSRSELQSSMGGSLVNLRNKVLGKNEVFYGGKIFTSVPPTNKQSKVKQKDNTRLGGLGVDINQTPVTKPANKVSIQSQRSAELLKLLLPKTERKCDKEDNKQTSGNKSLEPKKNGLSGDHKIQSNEVALPSLSHPSLDTFGKGVTKPNKSLNETREKKLPIKSKPPTNILKSRFNSIVSDYAKEKKSREKTSISFELELVPSVQKKEEVSSTQPKSSETSSKIVKIECPKADVNQTKLSSKRTTPASNNEQLLRTSLTGLNSENRQKKTSKAKSKALQFIRQYGPISNSCCKGPDGNKRKRITLEGNAVEEKDENKEKNFALSERFIELMNRPPVNEELIEYNEKKRFYEYYDKMEKKEQMEEKMLNTFKIDCKAVKCLKCKYTWFSASEMCKSEGHPIKVVDAEKRFFKCGKCTNRTVSLTIIPLIACRNCGSSNWLKAPMIREKINKSSVTLSIRGGEQKFMNSHVTDANLDLVVAAD